MKIQLAVMAACVAWLSVGSVARADYGDYGDRWNEETYGENQFLSAAAGISDPGATTSVYENPAGLSRVDDFELTLQGGSNQDNLGNPVFSGGLLYGGSTFGLAAGIQQATAGNGTTSAFYGVSAYASGIRTALGISGLTAFNNGGGSQFNLGLLIGVTTDINLGLDVFGLNGGPNSYGFGLAYQMATAASLVADFAADHDFGNLEAQPGIKVGTRNAAVTISYGFAFNGTVFNEQIADGLSVGGGFTIGRASLQIYYQHLDRLYATFGVQL